MFWNHLKHCTFGPYWGSRWSLILEIVKHLLIAKLPVAPSKHWRFCYIFRIHGILLFPSCLERSLETVREECHWLRSVSWDLCVQCRLCPGKVDPNTGNCIWHDTEGCLHDDCAHYIPLKSCKFYCPDTKGDESFLHEENFESWVQVGKFSWLSLYNS